MLSIQKKSIRSLSSNLPSSLVGRKLTLAVDFKTNRNKALKIGFSNDPLVGDTITPKPVGPATKFNVHGKEKILRDQPKQKLYRTQEWTHEEWRGKGETVTVTSLVDIPYYRYPRQTIEGFGHALTIKDNGGSKLVSLSSVIAYNEANNDSLTSAINIFLEVFGHVDIYDETLEVILTPSEVRRLNWIILPKGKKITEAELKDILSKSRRIRPVELLRQERISSFGPDIRAIGMGGFTGYVIYVFSKKKIAVLESIKYGNASYVIASSNWEELSKMNKQQLLAKSLVKQREIHTKRWFAKIKYLLT
jgi:hypothetical protein